MQDEHQNAVKSYRTRAGLKVRELAQRWGTSFATLSRIENGTQRIPENLLPIIVRDTGVPAKELRPDLIERNEQLSELLGGAQ